MVPPGDNLEFMTSGYIRERIKNAPEILDSAKAVLRNNPRAGFEIASGVMILEFEFNERKFVILFKRRGNSIGLMYLFSEDDRALISIKMEELRKRYKKGDLP